MPPVVRLALLTAGLCLAVPTPAPAAPAAPPATAAEPCPAFPVLPPRADRPRVGLVLSGGGARGAAHVGVLKVVEEYGIPVDLVVGTSMGSIVGGLYASGMPLPELEKLVNDTDWAEVLDDAPPRTSLALRRKAEDRAFATGGRIGLRRDGFRLPAGAREGHNVRLLLRGLTRHVADQACFARLPVPFAAVATDAQTAESVVLDHGDLVTALRASMAIPGYFSPVEIDGRLLVDGGVANNMPVSVARAMGADVVIAIDIASPLASREQMRNLLTLSLQMTTILARRGADAERAALRPEDLLVTPDLNGVATLDFPRMKLAVVAGETAARTALANSTLRGLAPAETRPSVQQTERWQAARAPATITQIRIDGSPVVPEQQILDRLNLQPGDTVDARSISRGVGRVQGLDYFSVVDYRLDDAGVLTLAPVARDWGPNYLQFGLSLYNNFEGIDRYELGASYTATALNRLTGQLFLQLLLGDTQRVYAELYQPTTQRAKLFVAPWALYERSSIDLYRASNPIARLRTGREELGLDLGVTRRFAEWRLGAGYGTRRLDPLILTAALPEFRSQVGYTRLTGFLDTFNQRDFPDTGSLLRLHAENGTPGLGADAAYQLGTLEYDHAFSAGKFAIEAGTILKSQHLDAGMALAPMQLGGVLRMSAFAPGELSGDHAGMVRLSLRRPLNELRWLRVHGGVSLEYGGAWNGTSADDIATNDLWPVASAFVALNTPLGPLWLIGGLSENERAAVQMQLGTRF